MADEHEATGGLLLRQGQALIAVPDEVDGEHVTRYFAGAEAAEAWLSERRMDAALSAVGAWADLAWEDWEAWSEARKDEVTPTTPIDEP